jgi:hypothetical protein
MQLLAKILKASELKIVRSKMESTLSQARNRFRNLTPQEIEILEKNHNICTQWSDLLVESGFTPENVRFCSFSGVNFLPRFYGTVMTPGGVSMPTGIMNSTVHNSFVENSCIHNVSLLSNTYIAQGAILTNVGTLVCSGYTRYGMGAKIQVGTELGNRFLYALPEFTLEALQIWIMQRSNKEQLAATEQLAKEFAEAIEFNFTYIGKDATVSNTSILRNSYIGDGTRIDGAQKIRNCTILSSLEQPTGIFDGVIMENTMVQWGCKIHSNAQLEKSILLEQCSVGKSALLQHAVIAPNTHIQQAEVTSSFIGPFVGIHHHSLVISVLWPEGCGNIAYGANVGSNHTGRMPDQEFRPGIGLFVGLGASIKFPGNFSEAPWSLISTGVILNPQRNRLPFALILPAGQHQVEKGNELIPGWTYGENSFALERNIYKYTTRNQARKHSFEISLFAHNTCRLVLDAYKLLLDVREVKEFYTSKDLPCLGSCWLRESARQKGIRYYAEYLERFAIKDVMYQVEQNPEKYLKKEDVRRLYVGELTREIAKVLRLPDSVPLIVKHYRSLEKHWRDSVFISYEKDFKRGQQIFDDYADVHPQANSTLDFCEENYQDARKKSAALMRTHKALI